MVYKPEQDEVFFCGKCDRQQSPKEGEKCKQCGKLTVSWKTNKESHSQAMKRWKSING